MGSFSKTKKLTPGSESSIMTDSELANQNVCVCVGVANATM